jgi:two-component system alkaline phosphatase synthesis response regulator PhoP
METGKKVLIIEDDVDLVEAVKTILEAKQIELLAAYTPDEGITLARQHQPDLIILDVMFGKNGKTEGFELARKIRQDPDLSRIPILMETSVNTEHPGFNFSAKDQDFLPVDDFINKPANPAELIEKIGRLLDLPVSIVSN